LSAKETLGCAAIIVAVSSLPVGIYICFAFFHAAEVRQTAGHAGRIAYVANLVFEHQVDDAYNYDFQAQVPGPGFLRHIVGDKAFCNVVGVQIFDIRHPEDIPILSSVDGLRYIQILGWEEAPLRDEHLACIKQFRDLRVLSLPNCSTITELGIRNVVDNPNLTILDIRGIPVGDEAIDELVKLKRLERLYIEDTNITKEGIRRLRKEMPSCYIGSCVSKSFLFNREFF